MYILIKMHCPFQIKRLKIQDNLYLKNNRLHYKTKLAYAKKKQN